MRSTRVRLNALFGEIALGMLAVLLGSLPAEAQPFSRGMWVYGLTARNSSTCPLTTSLLHDDPTASQLLSFCGANQITELYLSLGPRAVTLSDPRLPNFIAALKGSGRRVEALISCTRTDAPTCETLTWMTRINQVMAYNESHLANEGFDGIHLDLEPWTDTGNDFSWVPVLINYGSSGFRVATRMR